MIHLFIIRKLFLDHQSKRYWKVVVNRMVLYFKHIPPPEETGWINWKRNLCSHYDIAKEEADELVGSILTFAYNNKLPGEKEMKLNKSYRWISAVLALMLLLSAASLGACGTEGEKKVLSM